MYSVVIIDDEVKSRNTLKNLLTDLCPNVRVIGEAGGVASGKSVIQKNNPDAVFLDIRLEDGLGFDIFDEFPNPSFQVIFTTGYNEYAVDAFKWSAIDYLLKPINPEELVKAVEKLGAKEAGVEQRLVNLLNSIQRQEERKIALSTTKGWTFWKLDDIVRLESDNNMTYFFDTSGKKILVAKTILAYEEILPPHQFYRCHKSHIVNKKYVKEVLREDGGYAILDNDDKVPVSRRRHKGFLDWLRGGNLE